MPTLRQNNFALGQRADGGAREDALSGLRRLVNYDLQYGADRTYLIVRPGYEYYNTNELPAVPTHVESFVDQQENDDVLAVCNDKWYRVGETISHVQISSYDAPSNPVMLQWGNQAFLQTDASDDDDPGFVWTSNDALAGVFKSYRLGIKKPTEAPALEATAKEGNTGSHGVYYMRMNNTDQYKLAIEYTPVIDQEVREIYPYCRRWENRQDLSGNWRIAIYTDNGVEPSSTLVDENATTEQIPVSTFSYGSFAAKRFRFQDVIRLEAGTKYFFVVEGDQAYHDNFRASGLVSDFYGGIALRTSGYTYAPSQAFSLLPATGWSAFTREAVWYIGAMDTSDPKAYEYVYTYYNSTYQCESRPSDGARVDPDTNQGIKITGYVNSSDPQVDKIRFYRRELPDIDSVDDDITDTYKYVTEVDVGSYFMDTMGTSQLGAELQTQDHYCLDDYSEEPEQGLRTSPIVPYCACMWKGRMWIGEEDSNGLAFSKIFEEDGATNQIGLSSPEYFPLENIMVLPEPAHPIALYPVSNNLLVVHMSNDTSYMIYGGDQALNPPPDFSIRPLTHSNSSYGIYAGCLHNTYHYYLSRAGLYRVSGFGAGKPEFISEENQSIYDAVDNEHLDKSVLMTVGNEIWSLIDFDNDGELDTILILDMQRAVRSRNLYDRPWRMYHYDVNLNDLCVVTTADDIQQIYAADTESKYILKLRQGTTDNGNAITAYSETHDISSPLKTMAYQIDVDAYYPDITAIPTYTWLATDHAGNTAEGTMSPNAIDDIRGHRSGIRLRGATSVRVKLSQVSTKRDIIRGYEIGFTTT